MIYISLLEPHGREAFVLLSLDSKAQEKGVEQL